MHPEIDAERAVGNLRALIRIPTMSQLDESTTDWREFVAFREELARRYPKVHAALHLELVDGHSMLFRWSGVDNEASAVLMAHYDVVPATSEGWEHPPFAAELVEAAGEQVVWGRGALDDKGSLVCILEAIETLIAAGHQPRHDVYLSFGHNEETAGTGAHVIVDLLEKRDVRPTLVLDEGGAVVEGIFPGVTDPIAVVGVSEKGIFSLRLAVEQQGGHASTPPKMTATVRLARAIVRLNRRPFTPSFVATNVEMIRTLGVHASQPLKWIFTHLGVTKLPLLVLFSRLSDETSAMVRTTQAVTQLNGAQAANALAERAEAIVNIRVAINSSVDKTVAHVRKAIHDDAVTMEVLHPSEPSPVSPTEGSAWNLVRESVEVSFPGTIVTPYVMLGASDSRHFTRISDHVYRFSPFEMSKDERGTLHAKNERIRVSTFLKGIAFYTHLISHL